MTGTFVGFVRFAGGSIDLRYEHQGRRAAGGTRPERVGTRHLDNALFIHSQSETGLLSGRGGRSLFAASARLDNRSELAEALGLSAADLARASDEALLLRMFERWGGDGVARCLGAFAFAHWAADTRRLTLGRDCLGHCSLLFHPAGDGVVFSNRIGALLALPDVPREINDMALANLLAVNQFGPRGTAYRGIERTPSRSLVTIDRAGVRHEYYWSPDFDAPPPYRRDEDYVARARELFDQAVLSTTAGAGDVAIATSGGLDSSAIAATVARLGCASRIVCYTALPPPDVNVTVKPHQYRDERDKVESLGRMYPALDLNFMTRDGLHPFDEDHARFFAEALLPRMAGIAVGGAGFMIDTMSAHRLVLYGLAGNLGLTWTGRCSLLALARAGQWATLARELPLVARQKRQDVGRTFVSDVVRLAMPPGLRRLERKIRGHDPDGVAHYCALNPDFIAQNNLPQLWREQGFDPWLEPDGWNPARWRARMLFDKTGADRDNHDWPAQKRGLARRDPYADRRLLEFALAVPESLYRRNGVPRSFARAVFADRLPREILQETRRGANNLAWFRTLDRRRPQIAAEVEYMEASPTACRLIDVPRLKRLLDQWPKDERDAQFRSTEYRAVLDRAVHIGNFIRWVERANA